MAKSKVGALDAALQYVKNKLPQTGFFSTLDELIANAPFEKAPLQEWKNYLQPGRTLEREGVRFPLKKEEIDYSGLNEGILGTFNGETINKDQLREIIQGGRPDLALRVGVPVEFGQSAGSFALRRFPAEHATGTIQGARRPPVMARARYEDWAHPTQPGGYEESSTRSTDFGQYDTHFGPDVLSHSRTTLQPTTDEKLMRLVEEIQSDRHQAAAERPMTAKSITAPTEYGPRRGYRTVENERELRKVRELIDSQVGSEGRSDPVALYARKNELENRVPDAPFKDPADYGLLELKNQLLNAAKQDQDYLGIVRGADVSERFSQSEEDARGTSHIYDEVYPSQLKKLARQYGIEVGDVEVPGLADKIDIRPQAMRDVDAEDIPRLFTLVDSRHEDRYPKEFNDDLSDVHQVLDEYALELGDHPSASEMIALARKSLKNWMTKNDNFYKSYDARLNEGWNNKALNDLIDEHFQKITPERQTAETSMSALEDIWNEVKATENQKTTKSFPALKLTPEIREKIKKAGVPIWALTGAALTGLGTNEESPGMSSGGSIREMVAGKRDDDVPALKRLAELARKVGPEGGAEPRARVLSGLMSQVYGFDDEGKAAFWNTHPGIIDETLSIPTLVELLGFKAPQFAKNAEARTERLRDLVRKNMGLEEPHGFGENFDESLGVMLGQLPVPASKLKAIKEIGTGREAAGILGKLLSSPVEFASPTIDPKLINYLTGAGLGGGLGAATEEEPVQEKAEGGKVEATAPLRQMLDELRNRMNQLTEGYDAFEI